MTTNRFFNMLATTAVLGLAALADAKPWKSAEMITRETYKYGAFEARIKAAEGSGFITTFFLWKHGSEVPGAEWQEQDFEMWGKDGLVQTQAMTPGNPRTEHVGSHTLPTKAYDRYYTYRMEWTPTYLAYYIDGNLVRKETDTLVYSKLLNPARAEAMQLRTGIWAGDFSWSGAFDSTKAPQDSYVNWLTVYDYTPGAGTNGSDFTLRWKDDFNTLDWNRWWSANWTFEFSVADYTSRNLAVKDGILVQMFRHWTTEGTLPSTVPVDDGKELLGAGGASISAIPGTIRATSYSAFADNTVSNLGSKKLCGTDDVDKEPTTDPSGGCNIAFTEVGEWLEYKVYSPDDALYSVTARMASNVIDPAVRILVDGVEVGTAQATSHTGWQKWSDIPAGTVVLTKGLHTVRMEIVAANTNILSLNFQRDGDVPTAPAQVTGLTATAVGAQFDLSWNNAGEGVTYTVNRTVNGVTSVATTTESTSWTELTVTEGVPYVYTVVATNSIGSSIASEPVTVSYGHVISLPGATTGLTASAGNAKVVLSWGSATGAASYNVYRDEVLVANVTATTLTLDALVNGNTYSFRVAGLNADGEGALSAPTTATPSAPLPVLPAQVTGLTGTAGDASASIAWTAAANATSYEVYRDEILVATIPATAYAATGLLNGTSYSFRIVAVNADGSAPSSATVTVVPAIPVAPAANVKAQLLSRQTGASTNGISPLLKLVNTGSVDVALSDLTVRYWYTNEGSKSQSYWCDWAQIGQSNIVASFKTVSPARLNADTYLELGFKTTAGTLKAGANSGEIQSRFSKSDWSNYTQTNDHSFSATATSYVDWNKVTVYYKGQLIWGVEP